MITTKSRITLKDVADVAHVSATTVSLALRSDPRLPTDTTERVRSIARQLGYQRDPWLSSLSSYRKSQRRNPGHTIIALLTNWNEKDDWRRRETFRKYHDGIKDQAEAIGFRTEEFWLPENGGARRTAEILYHRGINGVVVFPLPAEEDKLEFNFSNFSAIQIGRSLHTPPLHSVSHNHFKAVVTALEELTALGYRRIGLAIPKAHDDIQSARWSGAFLGQQKHFGEQIGNAPIFLADNFEKASFIKWVKRHNCDAVLSTEDCAHQWLVEEGYQIPKDIGFAHLTMDNAKQLSGILLNSTQTGAQAINLLNTFITSGQRGIPQTPLTLVVDGAWHPGNTLRPQ
ncbi:LacI family DNA-binding transcriptional regulator [Cerasicoccus frondis]|uniref:LacI family DNA-binding transcriptional regulator n=1 Tax=Cerasicoccus frondis TaxID=490090 RepID=UPI0028525748|nr:LacI family DNA-binding transcriptional regulator [Cerasicoccus frondis]